VRPHLRFWPKGVAHELRVPRATLPEYLETAARRYPDKPAIVYGGAVLSYAALHGQVLALAGFLQQRLGVARGDRVLVASQNCPQFVAAAYAVLRAGAVVVPVNAMCKREEIHHLAADSGARVALVAQDVLREVPLGEGAGELHQVVVHAYADALAGAQPDPGLPDWVLAPRERLDDARLHAFGDAVALQLRPSPMAAAPDDLAVLPYTSGTTGRPKGCRHSHHTILASLAASSVWKRLHVETVVLAVAPLFHMLGLQNGMNMPIFLGGTSVMLPRWDPAQALRLIEQHRVSAWTAPPAMVMDLFAHPEAKQRDLSSLAVLTGGGAAMPAAVAQMLRDDHGLAYQEGYGLTETASFLQANPPDRCKPQCLGIPAQSVDTRIVDPETLRELPPGEVGEIVCRAPQIMLGYWRNPEADAEAFVEIDGQRFFRTGDLGATDEEGYFFLRDRLKRMINASGYKVWPTEVENAMYAHPAIQEACVIGVPDGRRGETVKALVVLKAGQRGALDADTLIAWCRERMAVYKAPRRIEFRDSLPRTPTGKLAWRELQEAERLKENIHA
jgi:fatty-acyl-CoA synthase